MPSRPDPLLGARETEPEDGRHNSIVAMGTEGEQVNRPIHNLSANFLLYEGQEQLL